MNCSSIYLRVRLLLLAGYCLNLTLKNSYMRKKASLLMCFAVSIGVASIAQTYPSDTIIANYPVHPKTNLFVCLKADSALIINSINDSSSTKVIYGIAGKKSIAAKILFGIASFYSKSLDGTKTSTGETFRHKKLTAASNNFALGTWVKVTNLTNGNSIIVRINDRMSPRMARKGRVVDLSHTAAKMLDFIDAGIINVKVEEIVKDPTD